jgi:hypothetical protein
MIDFYKQWLDNEYHQWVEALQICTVDNFKEHPMVQRMLGDFEWPEQFKSKLEPKLQELLIQIDDVGREKKGFISGVCWRMIYYARQVMQREPPSIVEIGGGAGEFYAVLRALGYEGEYYIYDLSRVKAFQYSYLRTLGYRTKLYLKQHRYFDFCVSFYALGEFDDILKSSYIETVLNKCEHGFVLWNPHSGASAEIPFPCTMIDEYPLLDPGNKQLEW